MPDSWGLSWPLPCGSSPSSPVGGILPAAPYFQEMPIRLHADLMFGLFLLPLLSAFLFYNFRSVSNETYVYPFKRFPIVYGGLTLLLFPLSYPGMILYFHALSLLLLIGLSWLSMAYSGGKYGKVMPSFEEGDPPRYFLLVSSLEFSGCGRCSSRPSESEDPAPWFWGDT